MASESKQKQLLLNMPPYVAEKLQRIADALYRKNRTAACIDLIMQAPEPKPIEIAELKLEGEHFAQYDARLREWLKGRCKKELARFAVQHQRDGFESPIYVEGRTIKDEVQGFTIAIMYASWNSHDFVTNHRWTYIVGSREWVD